jgi:hypothetical protein
VAVKGDDMLAAQPAERLHHHIDHLRICHAERLRRRAGGVCKRPEEIEDRCHTQFAPGTGGMSHRRMKHRRKAKADARLLDTARHALRR